MKNPEDESEDDDSGIHSLNSKLDLSLLKSPTMPKSKKPSSMPQQTLQEDAVVVNNKGNHEKERVEPKSPARNFSLLSSLGRSRSAREYVFSPACHTRSNTKKRNKVVSIIGNIDINNLFNRRKFNKRTR